MVKIPPFSVNALQESAHVHLLSSQAMDAFSLAEVPIFIASAYIQETLDGYLTAKVIAFKFVSLRTKLKTYAANVQPKGGISTSLWLSDWRYHIELRDNTVSM